ncbi:hypothetical protein [Nocardia vinacea]|uniref:hypothetical protein n=1 Tax=Nocardia vinacea TaxID=96468 RepID=UPI000593BD9C|nr:hypothetical protein [Nocardia vinacea]
MTRNELGANMIRWNPFSRNNNGAQPAKQTGPTQQAPSHTDTVTAARTAIAGSTAADPRHIDRVLDLAEALQHNFESTCEPSDLTAAADLFRTALYNTAGFAPLAVTIGDRPLGELGHPAYGRMNDYEQEPIKQFEQFLRRGRQKIGHGPAWLAAGHTLGVILADRVDSIFEPAIAIEAVRTLREVLDALPGDDPRRPDCLADLGDALGTQFERENGPFSTTPADPALLDDAVRYCREGLSTAGDTDPQHRRLALSGTLLIRYMHTSQRSDIEEYVTVLRTVVASTDPTHPHRGMLAWRLRVGLDYLAAHSDPH